MIIEFFNILGPKECQNLNIDFKNIAKSDNNRHFSSTHLKRVLANGDIVDRDWILYSPSTNSMDSKFSFLIQLKELDLSDISTACQNIAAFYENDVEEKESIPECEIAKQYFFVDPSTTCSHASMYSQIMKDELQTIFPNIAIILRIFLCLFVTNIPDERSFSKLKYIKDSLRNRMNEEKLNAFALMSIENEILESIDLDNVIDEFVLLKNRKMDISTM